MAFDRANQRHLQVLTRRLSPERLAPYRATAGSVHAAIALYEWNTAASAALYGTLQALEVVLRNAMHEQLTAWHVRAGLPGTWFDDPLGLLGVRCHKDIADARLRVRRDGYLETPDRIVTELTFGFWRYLLASRYHDTLWVPALRHAFGNLRPQQRRSVYDPLARLHSLRNRIAHHEPIHRRNLVNDQADALKILSAICPVTTSWVDQTSSVPLVLAGRPIVPAPRRG